MGGSVLSQPQLADRSLLQFDGCLTFSYLAVPAGPRPENAPTPQIQDHRVETWQQHTPREIGDSIQTVSPRSPQQENREEWWTTVTSALSVSWWRHRAAAERRKASVRYKQLLNGVGGQLGGLNCRHKNPEWIISDTNQKILNAWGGMGTLSRVCSAHLYDILKWVIGVIGWHRVVFSYPIC